MQTTTVVVEWRTDDRKRTNQQAINAYKGIRESEHSCGSKAQLKLDNDSNMTEENMETI